MISPPEITEKVRELRQKFSSRDQAIQDIHQVRQGNLENVAPDMFSDDIQKPIVQNFIDVAARTTAEMLAPLPAFNCSSASMTSDTARKFADKKTTILSHYLQVSNLQAQMYTAADYYVSYGMMPFAIEPDFNLKIPRLTAFDPTGFYPEFNRWNQLISGTRVIRKSVMDLCNLYPALAKYICGQYLSPNSQAILDIYIYHDKDQWTMLIPERHDLVLSESGNLIGRPCMTVACRPGVTETPRGQFDDVVWIQLARNQFSMMAMEAAQQIIEAPMAVPYDVQEYAVGPMSTIRTNNPQAVRRVGIEAVPLQGALQEGQNLQMELAQGSRFPETLNGNTNASVITGQGIHALQGGYNSLLQAGQEVFRGMFNEAASIMFEMDEKIWPTDEKDIRGQVDGVPYSLKYKPERDIAGDYTCEVTYGFSMGMDPNRALVALLQMRGDHLISRDFTRRQFPFGINVTEEEAKIEVEELRTALLASVGAISQSIPALIGQGGDPMQILAQLGEVIKLRQKGKPLEDAVTMAFTPPEPSPEEQAMMDQQQGQPGLSPGMGGGGGQAPMDIMSLLAGLNGGTGQPFTSSAIKRTL